MSLLSLVNYSCLCGCSLLPRCHHLPFLASSSIPWGISSTLAAPLLPSLKCQISAVATPSSYTSPLSLMVLVADTVASEAQAWGSSEPNYLHSPETTQAPWQIQHHVCHRPENC